MDRHRFGGQKGIFSVLAATSAKDVKVYTFEPAPESFASLCRNLELNALSNVKGFNVAVSSKEGEAVLHLAAESVCNSLIQRSDVAQRGDVRVEVWSMAKLLKALPAPINLLKMDIEGMEYDALLSCSDEDLKRVERIALEYHDDHIRTGRSNSELIQFLNERGFSTDLHPERRILLAARTPCPAPQLGRTIG
jgi:FkbM family methyltransferase